MSDRQMSMLEGEPQSISLEGAELTYYPAYLSDQLQWFDQLAEALAWEQSTISLYGKPVKIPRLNAWYGDEGAAYQYSGLQLTPLPWAPPLAALRDKLEATLGVRFNSVLANFYRDGQDSVAWHSDDEPELGERPLIASISLGASRRFSLKPKRHGGKPLTHIELQGGSLLVMAGETQRNYYHQIAKTTRVSEGRINLTFRQVFINQ